MIVRETRTVSGTYGGSFTPCEVLVAEMSDSSKWYCVEGSQNVNRTMDDIEDGVDVETLGDFDCFTWPDGVDSEEELEEAIES